MSQDIITKNDGSDTETVIKEITIDGVKYVKYSNQDGPLYTISKSDVFRIKYFNGEVETFNNDLSSKSISTDLERKVNLIISNNERHRVGYNTGKFMSLGGSLLTIIASFESNGTMILIGSISTLVGEILVWGSHGWFGSNKIHNYSNAVADNKNSMNSQNEINNVFSTEKSLLGPDGVFSSDDFIIGQDISIIDWDGLMLSGRVLNNKNKTLIIKDNNGKKILFWYTEIKEAYEM